MCGWESWGAERGLGEMPPETRLDQGALPSSQGQGAPSLLPRDSCAHCGDMHGPDPGDCCPKPAFTHSKGACAQGNTRVTAGHPCNEGTLGVGLARDASLGVWEGPCLQAVLGPSALGSRKETQPNCSTEAHRLSEAKATLG